MKKLFVTIFIVLNQFCYSAALKTDSLWSVWNNTQQPDTVRLKAIHDFAWEGYGYSQPDSAFYFAQLEYDFANSKSLKSWMAKALKTQGNTLVIRGEYVKAYDYFLRSLTLSTESGDKMGIGGTLHSIGIIYYYQGDYSKALNYYQQGLRIREEMNDQAGISGSLNNIGIVYSKQGHLDNALNYFSRALEIVRRTGDKRGEASALNNIGLVYKDKAELDNAFDYFILSLKLNEELGDKRDIAAALNNIGSIYEAKGLYHQALENFHRSVELKKEIGDQQGIAITLSSMGFVHQKLGNLKSSVTWCSEALEASEMIGALVEQQKACECLYNTYKLLKDDHNALVYHEKMLLINDSLQEEETNKSLRQMEFVRQMFADSVARAGEKLKMEQAHRAEVRKKNRVRNILLGTSFMLLLGAGALYSRMLFIRKSKAEISKEKDRAENLLLNILPEEIARELKEKGKATARKYEKVSILFTDFKEFTQVASNLTPETLVGELNKFFMAFDAICDKFKIEKIKTIGDAYMAAGGLPLPLEISVKNTVLAALEMTRIVIESKESPKLFEMRAGIHTGPVVAGIVGVKKFQYDVWGDTVNIASRMESAGEPGKVNISKATYDLLKDDPDFSFEYRGCIEAKGKGKVEMYFVSLKKDAVNIPGNPGYNHAGSVT